MELPTVNELLEGERKFLHDIANNIVVIQGMSGLVLMTLKKNPAVDPREIERLEKAIDATTKMTNQLKERRTFLKSFSE